MTTRSKTLLCIDRDPSLLRLRKRFLVKNGYSVMTATTGHAGLRLFSQGRVDAVVLGQCQGLMYGAVVASAMKLVKPQVPIVMLSESLELPDSAYQSVDVVVINDDGPRFLSSTIQSMLVEEAVPLTRIRCRTVLTDDSEGDPAHVLDDLKTLIDGFPDKVRQHVVADVRTVLTQLKV